MILLLYGLAITFFEMICADIIFSSFCSKKSNNKCFNISIYLLLWGVLFSVCNLDFIKNRLALKIVLIILMLALFMYVVYSYHIYIVTYLTF